MATDVLRLKKEEVAFAAFAAWDVAGSKAYGYSTFWVNRMRVLPEHLGGVADFSDETLEGLLR
jgi:2-haloacid dehalogenase